MEFIDKLKQKPKRVRQRIALFTSASISVLIFSMWWTTFTAPEADSSQVPLEEALSPVASLGKMTHNAIKGVGAFSENLKARVTQIQYEASGSESELNTAAASQSDDGHLPSTQDVVYPEQIFGSDPPEQSRETKSATATNEEPTTETN